MGREIGGSAALEGGKAMGSWIAVAGSDPLGSQAPQEPLEAGA